MIVAYRTSYHRLVIEIVWSTILIPREIIYYATYAIIIYNVVET